MAEQQLNIWIPETQKTFLDNRAKAGDTSVKAIIKGLIEQDMARASGEQVERDSLPAIRMLVREEIQRAMAELYARVQEAMVRDLRDVLKDDAHRNTTKLARLLTRSIRDSGIMRRLLYALVSKLTSKKFAAHAYEHAEETTNQELSERIATMPPSPLMEKELEE